mgnify:CR=1 FL=1
MKRKVIVILIIVSISFVNMSYARYIKNECLNIVQEIANPVLEVEEGKIIKIDKINNTGFYEFSIKNFNSKKISEIDSEYTIEIISDIKDVVKFELYNGEKQIQLQNLKTEPVLIKGNNKIKEDYKLKIIYNNVNNIKSNIISNIQIKIHSEQEKNNKNV